MLFGTAIDAGLTLHRRLAANVRLGTAIEGGVEARGAGLRDHDRVADLIVARRSIDRPAIRENLIF